ncbi:hypothetical protein D3C85_1411960 [compost metagenome]
MVFLRPTIVRSRQDLAEISQDRYKALRELSQPDSRQNNSLSLPQDPHRLFDERRERAVP